MKKLLICFLLYIHSLNGQTSISLKLNRASKIDVQTFMDMSGFNYANFSIKSKAKLFLEIQIEEYKHDTLINQIVIPKIEKELDSSFLTYITPKIKRGKNSFKLYSLLKNDTSVKLYFLINKIGYYKTISLNHNFVDYSWKEANLKSIYLTQTLFTPIFYFSTGEELIQEREGVKRFCAISEIMKIKKEREKIAHFFVISMKTRDKL